MLGPAAKGGPPPSLVKQKHCGADQDEEECPTQEKPLPWSIAKEAYNMKPLLENYLHFLATDLRPLEKEWQGPNLPVEGDNRPNWIRKCMMLESDRQKINCLRKLRDQVAMNPQYQSRIDRFVDAITQTYEPTDKPGTIPGNEFVSEAAVVDVVAATATIASIIFLVIHASNEIYKIYLSKAARACRGEKIKKGHKIECITKYKVEGLKKQIAFIKSRMKECSKHKHPDMCRARLNNYIELRRQKIDKLIGQMR